LPRIPNVFLKDCVPHGPPESHNEPSDISTKFRQTRLFEIESRSAFQGVVNFLKTHNYQTESCEGKYVLAKHLKYDKNVFVVVAPHEEYVNYERVRSIVIDLQKFIDVIFNLNRAYEKLLARTTSSQANDASFISGITLRQTATLATFLSSGTNRLRGCRWSKSPGSGKPLTIQCKYIQLFFLAEPVMQPIRMILVNICPASSNGVLNSLL